MIYCNVGNNIASAFLTGYFIHEYWEWKEKAMDWYQQYEEVKPKK